MLELMVQLELIQERLRKKVLPIRGSNDYHLVGAILALVFGSGALGTVFVAAPVSLPAAGASFVIFAVAGVIAILTIVLLPLGLILL